MSSQPKCVSMPKPQPKPKGANAVSTNPTITNEYCNLPIAALVESPTNPRRRFNEENLQELANSLQSQGVLAPLLVRELEENKYEVVAGARRLRAARIAALESVPVRIVELSDAAAIEAQCVENLQREDIHPLEEALGFRALLDLKDAAYTPATIAARSGKSEAYVLGRIRLTELTPPIAEAFLADRIGIGHALLIAKLPAAQQQTAFTAAFRSMWTSEGNQQVLIPVRELAAWIESNILLELADAPFSKQDEKLLPDAGACTVCAKRTGFNTLLFADVHKDSCTDPVCFQAKLDAHIAQTIEAKPKLVQISSGWSSREGAPLGRNRYTELEIKKVKPNGSSAKLSPAQKPCEKMAEAIVMDGGKRGQIVKVCSDPNCRVHHPDRPSPQKLERERAEERKRIEQDKLAITIRFRILAAVLAKVGTPLKKADLVLIAQYVLAKLPYSQAQTLAKRHKVEADKSNASVESLLAKRFASYDEAGLCRTLLEISLLEAAYQQSRGVEDPLQETAKRYRIDIAKVEQVVKEQFTAKQNKRQGEKSKKKTDA